uniref:uncharacterized protein LOC120332036 n=1 Tax=Styela clava TaxID=7725 RepID=UPI00193A3D60|nr:uncharacterized protein LOC120332036 [Styela clava]
MRVSEKITVKSGNTDLQKDDGSEIARLIKKSLDEKRKAEIKRGVTYNSKLFRAVVYDDAYKVDVNDAPSICKSLNYGKPANIYDLAHYQLLLPYLRLLIADGWTKINLWTGMGYKNNQLLLSSGRPITIATEVWRPGNWRSHSAWTIVLVDVQEDSENKDQGIYNTIPLASCYGVICEI